MLAIIMAINGADAYFPCPSPRCLKKKMLQDETDGHLLFKCQSVCGKMYTSSAAQMYVVARLTVKVDEEITCSFFTKELDQVSKFHMTVYGHMEFRHLAQTML